MPRVKRTTTEVSEIEAPKQEAPPTPADIDLWDHLDKLKESEFMDGSRTVRAFYVYQDQPPVTKKEGESAYAKIYSERFGPEQLRAINPFATRWKIIEKIMGDNSIRRMWFVAMMPQQAATATPTFPMGGSQPSEMGAAFQEVVKLAQDKGSVQKQAMETSIEIMGSSYKKAIEMMPQQGSFADELGKLKTAGLLNTGGTGMDLDKIKALVEWSIPMLKEAGLIRPASQEDPEKKLDGLFRLLDVMETRFGKSDSKAGTLVTVLQTVGPQLAKSLENISNNIALVFQARASMSTAPQLAGASIQANTAPPGNPASAPPSIPPTRPDNISPQDYIKIRLVELCHEELEGGDPDAENIANWLQMTAPQLAGLLANASEAEVLKFLEADHILVQIGSSSEAVKFKTMVIRELSKAVKEAQGEPVPA